MPDAISEAYLTENRDELKKRLSPKREAETPRYVDDIDWEAVATQKWEEYDRDRSGMLHGSEVVDLAQWVWESFRPGKHMAEAAQTKEAAKLMKRCDKNGDHSIDQDEFTAYYAHIAKEMDLFVLEAAIRQGKHLSHLRNESKFAEFAREKWEKLDADKDGLLSGDDLTALASWVYSTLHPGEEPTAEELAFEHDRMMKLCDSNNDGAINELEFRVYYERTAIGLIKFKQSARARKKRAKKEEWQEFRSIFQFLGENDAQKKWNALDPDSNGRLEGNEIVELARWIWSVFHPDQHLSLPLEKFEVSKLLQDCDKNCDGSVDEEEFLEYYEKTKALRRKAEKEHEREVAEKAKGSPEQQAADRLIAYAAAKGIKMGTYKKVMHNPQIQERISQYPPFGEEAPLYPEREAPQRITSPRYSAEPSEYMRHARVRINP